MKKPVIAIDGYSSTGKSSVAKEIAKRLGITHIDTGALYRGITYFGLKNHYKNGKIDIPELIKNLSKINLEFREEEDGQILYLNNQNISADIRKPEISDHVSIIAMQKEIRDFLLTTQQQMSEKNGVVMDGRDIGTVVLPNAEYKFFLTADPAERARRRFLELVSAGENIDQETVKTNLMERDKADSEREISPLRQADDALLIDNTHIDKEQTIQLILSYIH